ncbi:MAG: shikimate kinase [Candidatus Micrarchaeota archaeon]|nr:shikimate kinase [Candidatus Micrarchaeota archaeon]
MKANCVVLIGMPGVGKSSVGSVLAKNLSYDFIDLDKYIEYTESTTIKQILRDSGEEYFLKLESEKMRQIDFSKSVVAPGGSIVYDERLMEQLKREATIVYLEDQLPKIRSRIRDSNLDAIVWNGNESIASLYLERKPLYEKHAEITISCTNRNERDIAREVYSRFTKKYNDLKIKQ